MKCRLFIFLPVLIFLFSGNGLAQPPVRPSPELAFQNFSHHNGLSDDKITCMYQDSRGFLWIGTPEGLNRFDGHTFERLYAGKKQGYFMPSNQISEICEYKRGYLLVATAGGFSVINIIEQDPYAPKDPLLASINGHFYLENSNKIWIYYDGGLLIVDSSLRIRKHIGKGNDLFSRINTIHSLNDGRILLVADGDYYFLNQENDALIPLPELKQGPPGAGSLFLFSYYDKQTNSVYASYWGKDLQILDFTNNRLRQVASSKNIRSIIRSSQGFIWLGGIEGLSILEEKKERQPSWHHIAEQRSSLVHNDVSFLLEDDKKNLWIGTVGGLSKLANSAISLTQYRKELELNGQGADIYDIVKGADNRIYVATYGNGVFSISPSGQIRNYGKDLIPFAWSVNKEGPNIIVTGHNKKMYRLFTTSGKTSLMPELKPYQDSGDLVLFAHQDRRGGWWYSINKQMGLFYTPPGERNLIRFSKKDREPPFPHSYFNMAEEDDYGRIWFAVNKNTELVSYSFSDKKFKVHSLDVPHAGINAILTGGKFIWVATDGTGLIRYDPESGTTRLYTLEDGLSGNNIKSLAYDKMQRLWAGSSKGLNCLLPGKQRFIHFGEANGLPETHFEDGAMYYDSSTNRLYAGARKTLFYFDPDEFIEPVMHFHSPLIDKILVNGKSISLTRQKQLDLLWDQNNLQFNFTAVNFENPGAITYYYKLDGAEREWNEAGVLHSISYSNLANGSYRFLVKAVSPAINEELEAAVPFKIIIHPPYWKTWWFRLLVIGVIASLLYILVRGYYLRKLERQRQSFEKNQAIEQERTRIATDMHDDLGAGLSKIKFLSQSLLYKKIKDEGITADLEKIRSFSDEMAEKMGEIIWALNQKNDTLADLVAYTRSYTVEYLATHHITCEAHTPLQFPAKLISGETRRNIFLSVKECLHNIVKHAGASKVFFSVHLDDNMKILIQDNGKGIDWNRNHIFSNGIKNLEKRMREVNGSVIFSNDNGTKVSLTIPLQL